MFFLHGIFHHAFLDVSWEERRYDGTGLGGGGEDLLLSTTDHDIIHQEYRCREKKDQGDSYRIDDLVVPFPGGNELLCRMD